MNARKIILIINRSYDFLLNAALHFMMSKIELGYIIRRSGKNKNCKKIDEWIKKWKPLGRFNKDYYRVFSQYCGEDVNIVPDDLLHNLIEPILNPKRFISTNEDKCLFDKMLWFSFGRFVTAPTYLRNICGSKYDMDYQPIDKCVTDLIPTDVNSLIVKPSLDSSSGRSISFFHRNLDGIFENVETGELLSDTWLIRYFKNNFGVQKAMKQSAFMSRLCKTSVNTLRVAVYRSVITNKSDVINTIIRMGKDGSLVDNAHAGGLFIGVDSDGRLGKYCCNQYGEKETVFNGIDFSNNEYVVPNYDKVKEFACRVADALPHQRLIALDIMLDESNEPVLIEYNIRAFSVWLFQFTNGSGFGKYTDEIIEYCIEHKREATRISVIF